MIIDIYHTNSKLLIIFSHRICADNYYLYVFKNNFVKEN